MKDGEEQFTVGGGLNYEVAPGIIARGTASQLDGSVLSLFPSRSRKYPAWKPPPPRHTRGLLAKYRRLVSTASKGAVTDGGLVVADLVLRPHVEDDTTGRRERPARLETVRTHVVRMPTSDSYPSGHAASAFAFSTAVGGVLPQLDAALRTLPRLADA